MSVSLIRCLLAVLALSENCDAIASKNVARLLGVTKQSISNWENDNIQPSIEMLVKLARSLSVSADYLLGLEERQILDVSGLSSQAIGHLQLVINDMKEKK